MTTRATARVEAAPNFLANLEQAHAFFALQDAASAASRLLRLKSDLREVVAILGWSPAGGRPARFLNAGSAQARLRTETVRRLAEQAGLPHLREFILEQHVVLYAHSDTEVVLLALKHQRQLAYSVSQ